MPYIKDTNGTRKYIPSKYAKEELPTWSEMFNEFYKGNITTYDPNDSSHIEEDLYWHLPHRKMLLGWICNQLNKMLFEDGRRDDILNLVNNNYEDLKNRVTNVYFILKPSVIDEDIEKLYHWDNMPVIYTCELPSTKKRSIFASDSPSINIKTLEGNLELKVIIDIKVSTFTVASDEESSYIFWDIVDELLKDMIEYFNGDLVGWKDDDGNIIPDLNGFKPGCGYDNGIDAAL